MFAGESQWHIFIGIQLWSPEFFSISNYTIDSSSLTLIAIIEIY
jgi:hypothetical protein